MSGVWVFRNGVVRLEKSGSDENEQKGQAKILYHTPTGEPITSYVMLEKMLKSLGWEPYYDDPNLLQFHKHSTLNLISLPKDFTKFKAIHMYDIVVKNQNCFQVMNK